MVTRKKHVAVLKMNYPVTYKFSIVMLAIAMPLILLYAIAIGVIILAGYYYHLALGLFLTIPLGVFLLDPFSRYVRYLYFAMIGKPALIIDRDKMIDNLNGEIFFWEDIDEMTFNKRNGYIAIKPVDHNKFIETTRNPYKRIIMELNRKYFGGMFSVQPNIIKGKKNEIYKTIINAQSRL